MCLKIPGRRARIIYQAIAPEAETLPSRRASVSLQADEETLVLRIDARDLVALRAAVNSFLRFVNSILETLDLVGEDLPNTP